MSDRASDGDGVRPEEPPEGAEPPRTVVEHAERVETEVVEEKGQWAVDIVVFFADSIVRRRISTYRTRARAEISARLIKRGAEREIEGPLNG